jgi:hypothetical protein
MRKIADKPLVAARANAANGRPFRTDANSDEVGGRAQKRSARNMKQARARPETGPSGELRRAMEQSFKRLEQAIRDGRRRDAVGSARPGKSVDLT